MPATFFILAAKEVDSWLFAEWLLGCVMVFEAGLDVDPSDDAGALSVEFDTTFAADVFVVEFVTRFLLAPVPLGVVAHPAKVNNTSPVIGIKVRRLLMINLLVFAHTIPDETTRFGVTIYDDPMVRILCRSVTLLAEPL